ncbi:UNVERIFIED_ORG: lysophospholipase L1-like esterase [Rhizobium esperanzae]
MELRHSGVIFDFFIFPVVSVSAILPVEASMLLGADYFGPSLQEPYTVDGVHPKAKTYEVIAEKLLSSLSGSCAIGNK